MMFTPRMIVAVRVLALLRKTWPATPEFPGEYLSGVHGLRDNTLRALWRRGVLSLRHDGGPMWSLTAKTAAIIDAVRA